MKTTIKLTRLSLFSTVLLASLIFSLTFVGYAQQAKLSLADILIGLRSNKVPLEDRNKILAGAVAERGVTFALTPEIEKELENTGADKILIGAIRQKSVKAEPTPTPTPIATPTPTPMPVATPTPSTAPPDFSFYQKQGNENIVKGEFDLALVNYNKAIELNPQNTSTYIGRGQAFFNKSDYKLAIADYDKAIELNPKELSAYSNRGITLEKMGELEKASADYKKVIELDAGNESAKNNLKRIEDEQLKLRQKEQSAVVRTEAVKSKEPEAVKPEESAATPEIVELGRLGPSNAIEMATPVYSSTAKSMNLKGQVTVEVLIDEEGKVTSAEATEGHRLLRANCEQAALKSRFKPAMVGDKAVKAKGFIVYNFVR